jgi:hypothetical protein
VNVAEAHNGLALHRRRQPSGARAWFGAIPHSDMRTRVLLPAASRASRGFWPVSSLQELLGILQKPPPPGVLENVTTSVMLSKGSLTNDDRQVLGGSFAMEPDLNMLPAYWAPRIADYGQRHGGRKLPFG